MAPARRDFSRAYSGDSGSGGFEDLLSTFVTTAVTVCVLGYMAKRFLRRGPSAAANANNNNNAAPTAVAGAAAKASGGGGLASRSGAEPGTLQERMSALAFSGWKVAVDVDALVSRPLGEKEPFPTLRTGTTPEYLKKMLDVGADVYVYCQVDRSREPSSSQNSNNTKKPFVGDATSDFVGQQALLDILKPFASNGLKREQVLFCSTSKGHESFTRQLKPTILITTRSSVVELLSRHVPYVVYVANSNSNEEEEGKKSTLANNVTTVHSLSAFLV